MVSVAAAGQLGAQALTTQAYTLQISYVALMFSLAIGFAVEIVVGHMIGARKLRDAQHLVRRALGVSLAVSLVATTIAALIAPWTLRQFTSDTNIINRGVMLLWLTIPLELGRTFNLVVINALRATGDARYPVVVGAGSMLLILAGGSWLLGVYLGYGLVGVWIAYVADEWIRGLMMWRRWASYGWIPHAKNARRRARQEHLVER
jgi:Na+-driven multidrug efflux pump